MRRLMISMLILVGLVAGPFSALSAFAQADDVPIPCGSLSDDDCDLLKASRDAMRDLASYDALVNVDVALTNLPNLPADLGFSLTSVGSFSAAPEVNQRLLELQQADPAEMLDNLEELLDAAIDFYAETQLDLELAASLSADLADLIATQGGLALPESIVLPIRLTGGVFYFNLDDLGTVLGDESLAGWFGVDIVRALEESTDAILEDATSGALPDAAAASMMLSGANSNQVMAEQFVEFVGVERLDDGEVDGVEVAQFLYTFDLAGFVSSPAFIDALLTQLASQADVQSMMGQAPPLSDEDMAMVADMLPMLAPMLLSGIQWQTLSSIGVEDGYVYETVTIVEWDLSTMTAMAGAMMGGQTIRPRRGADAAIFTMDVYAANSGFNEEKSIEAPDDAIMIPLDSTQMSIM